MMQICRLPLSGATLIKTSPIADHRGSFARLFCSKELSSVIGTRQVVNVNHSYTHRAGVIRGLHFQHYPHQEMKFVRCLRGAVYDVIVDLRQDSQTYMHWHSQVLDSRTMDMMCVPEGFAHGFQSLENNSEIVYFTTEYFTPECEGGVRYDDPAIGIDWPMAVTGISEKDASHPMISTETEDPVLHYG